MMPPYIHWSTSAARIAPTSWAAMYPGTRSQGKLPRTANASVTAGLRWAPEIVPMKKMIAQHHDPRRQRLHRQGQTRAERGRADHAAAGGDQDQQERSPHLAEQPAVLQPRVVELGVRLQLLSRASLQPRQHRLTGPGSGSLFGQRTAPESRPARHEVPATRSGSGAPIDVKKRYSPLDRYVRDAE